MKAPVLVLVTTLFLIACGGGGGSTGSSVTDQEGSGSTDYGSISLAGQTVVWSDETNWTLTAAAEKLDSATRSFELSDGGSGLEIDSTTGLIQGGVTEPGVYDLTISATDGSGASISTAFTFTSNAFLAGHWVLPTPSTGETLVMVVSRNGRVSLTNASAAGEITGLCSGQADIVGDTFSGNLSCVQSDSETAELTTYSLPVAGTAVEGSRITLANFNGDGDGVFVFQTGAEVFNFGTIVPGIYVEYSDIASGISLVEVTAEGVLNAIDPAALGFNDKRSRCTLSGNLEPDAIFADYELEALQAALQVFEATISLSDCDLGGGSVGSLDYDQSNALALGASFMDTLAGALSFNLYSPGNPATNNGFNASYFHFVHFCDQSNELTAVANLLADTERFSIIACPLET